MKTVTLNAKQRQEILERRRQTGERRIFQHLSALLWIDEGRTREEVAELEMGHEAGDVSEASELAGPVALHNPRRGAIG